MDSKLLESVEHLIAIFEHKIDETERKSHIRPNSLLECSTQHLVLLLRYHPQFDDKKINSFKEKIINYMEQNNIDGKTLLNTPRKQFSESLIAYHHNIKKIRGPANKCWDRFNKFELDFEFSSAKPIKISWKDKSFTWLYILHKTTLSSLRKAISNEFKVKYFRILYINTEKQRIEVDKTMDLDGAFVTDNDQTIGLFVEIIDMKRAPLHLFTVNDVCDLLKIWVYHDINYVKNLHQMQNMFRDMESETETITNLTMTELKQKLTSKGITEIMSTDTLDIILQRFTGT